MAAKNVTREQFATTVAFTADTAEFAKGKSVNLLDVQALLSLIGQRSAHQHAALRAEAVEGRDWRATWVNCGINIVK